MVVVLSEVYGREVYGTSDMGKRVVVRGKKREDYSQKLSPGTRPEWSTATEKGSSS